MTIWFSTNIPEMRAISTFNRVSTDIGEIQQRITTGQRINSGKDDPGGLLIREGLRAEIKGVQALQAGMLQAENLMEFAAGGMMQLLEVLNGPDIKDTTNTGLLGELNRTADYKDIQAGALKFMDLYDIAIATTRYGGQKLIAGELEDDPKTFQLGAGVTLEVAIGDLTSAPGGKARELKEAILAIDDADPTTLTTAIKAAEALVTSISSELGLLGASQKVVAQNQKLLDSRMTNITTAEGRISNADIAAESSRLARAELLAQNAMNSIMYTRSYAAFSVSSLFR
jgi:flagellin